ncbi:PH [Glarea lozoyensis ATCC 20868]|uniref:PH n=1 Tax=Glarea lozoyensis (strain ATCC 20868 / MF5171) TaxID=1116229 RepID=S3DEK3_GLAL2|nr:PH [Glarea lozoyensis ATCC 20868]EPE36817.1 PH [Glarea lozoyensis ATCC 20868]
MGSKLDGASLEKAFEGRPDLQNAIKLAAVGDNYIELFNQISVHVCKILPDHSEPASKKRRLDEPVPSRPANGINKNGATNEPAASSSDKILLEVKDISIVIPQRKKYTLCFTSTHLYARLPDSPEPVAGISYAWKDIEYAFCLPVPEKTQKQHNYIFFPKNTNIVPSKNSGPPPSSEPLVFTVPETPPKPGVISGSEATAAANVSDDLKTLFDWALAARLKTAGRSNLKIVQADPKLFASEIRQAHRPNEKAVFVKAFRGSKDGYLFFLPNGILWAFKKPLQFLPHERIAAVSYTSVLQRTFNLSIEVDMSTASNGTVSDETEEFEFSMLDQEDFGGIDTFVKRHGLQDKSMAEQRKAKRLNVNVVKDEDGNVIGNEEGGELERAANEAEQQAVDEEDEEEEDYDPGSEGDSEGSGTSDESEDDDEGGGGGRDDDEEDGEGDKDEL